jgi:hypothetical protein
MCYLCLKENPFDIDSNRHTDLFKKKKRASEIKLILHALKTMDVCSGGKEEVDKLKEEQYQLSREI